MFKGMMETGALLLLLSTLVGAASTQGFYGDSVSFSPLRRRDGDVEVTFHRRQSGGGGGGDCTGGWRQLACAAGGGCSEPEPGAVLQTDAAASGRGGGWCQAEGAATATVAAGNTSLTLRASGCCWVSNSNSRSEWSSEAVLDLGTRSDSHSFNSCPLSASVASLRVPQNCVSLLPLLAHDTDGDAVRCRFASGNAPHPNITLDQAACTLTKTGEMDVGVYVFELMLEDFPTKNLTLTYMDGTTAERQTDDGANTTPLCSLTLQFTVQVVAPLPNCEVGHSLPVFLSRTPSQGAVLHATVDQSFQLYAQAQAQHASIHDFQVSGPQNMTKDVKDDGDGKAALTLSWTPQISDLYRLVPVCFTAETDQAQSEMRCVVVTVTRTTAMQGKATVTCSANKMEVALEKASMPGIDENFLQLRDPLCSLTSNQTHIQGSMSFSTCGTKLEDKGDFIVFTNEINSFERPDEVIVRRKTVKIDFACQFPKSISISTYYNLHTSDYIFTESSFGSFGYNFEIFTDKQFTKKVATAAYPVQVKLLQMIYMGIHAEADLPKVRLFVESCKATPDDNPDNQLSYYLIKNGCQQDPTVKLHHSDQMSYNFEVQAFKFTGNYDQVYITCSVILCEMDSPFSRCAQGCLREPDRRRRSAGRETFSHYITQGPLQFIGLLDDGDQTGTEGNNTSAAATQPPVSPAPVSPEPVSPPPSRLQWSLRALLSSGISSGVLGGLLLLSLLVLAVMAVCVRRRRRADDRKALLVHNWDQ